MNLVVKDALWQILGRVASAIGGFLVIKLITPYLGPLRFGDYSTILKFFAIWSAFADFGIYVIALKQLGKIKSDTTQEEYMDLSTDIDPTVSQESGPITSAEHTGSKTYASSLLKATYGKFVSTRFFMIGIIYAVALVVAYLIPAYTSNPYLLRGLPLGMLFSASFMSAGILQLPLQLFRQMKQLTIALIVARVAQLVVVAISVFILYKKVDFTGSGMQSVTPFLWIIASVAVSGIAQAWYVWWTGKRYLPLKRVRDRSFTKSILGANRRYGVAYYLSSFHTLIVVILISIFYPTSAGFARVGIWALALGLIEILLIIPSALGNSLIHDVAGATHEQMMKKFGSLLTLVLWIGGVIIVNFTIFAPHIISFVGGTKFLSTTSQRGSDTVLPFLAMILTLSFTKQVFNYVFVTNNLHNNLLKINLVGVIIGVSIGVPIIVKHALLGGIITQGILEMLFVSGALYIARRHRALPIVHRPTLGVLFAGTVSLSLLGLKLLPFGPTQVRQWIATSLVLTAIITACSYKLLKRIMKSL